MQKKRKLILTGNPEEKFPVPADTTFELEGEFISADKCGEIGQALIAERPCFESLREARICYLWKRTGSAKPKMHLGKCQRPSGLLKHFASCDFVVWLAANNVRELALTRWQMEALVFHELKHARIEVDAKTGREIAVSVPHDAEEEIERYGLWKRDIEPIAAACAKAQPGLFEENGAVAPSIPPFANPATRDLRKDGAPEPKPEARA